MLIQSGRISICVLGRGRYINITSGNQIQRWKKCFLIDEAIKLANRFFSLHVNHFQER